MLSWLAMRRKSAPCIFVIALAMLVAGCHATAAQEKGQDAPPARPQGEVQQNATPPSAGRLHGQLDFCARPVPPKCVQEIEPDWPETRKKRCKAQLDRYVKSTFSYRRCLNLQLENEVRKTNEILDRFRCMAGEAKLSSRCQRYRKTRTDGASDGGEPAARSSE